MKKIANFIVDKRYLIMGVMVALAVLCALMIPRVEINTDMTKYLPDDSAMKQGVDIMEQEFEDTSIMQTIRVMFKDLSDDEKADIQSRLEAIPNVDSVTYKLNSEDYNQGEYTLYVVNTAFDYGSAEEKAIETAIQADFSEYELTVKNDNAAETELPIGIIAIALGILLVILFTMCASWFEPVLFLIAIGIAVVINMGTNVFLDSVSSTTNSIAAILQLVLSMDYSIILINRYRQEQQQHEDRFDAMKAALRAAFSAITSSAATTFVGLLMLVFMSFKIGMDLGVVLAKGVLFSLVSIFTVLPCLILVFDKVIRKTAKKEPHIPMGGMARFSYRMRRAFSVLFVVLFIGAYILQGFTPIIFTAEQEDPIADVFVPTNTLVMLYSNEDADKIVPLTDELEEHPSVRSAVSHPTTLGRPYTSAELLDVIEDMDVDMELDSTMLNILYYDYYLEGELPPIKASELIRFVADEVAPNETFADYMDDDIIENVDTMRKFSDPDTLSRPMNAAELADFFDMERDDIRQLFLYYYTENGGVDSGRMNLATFAAFITNDVLTDPDYASMIPASARTQISQLTTFADVKKMTEPLSYGDLAGLMEMDAGQVKLLYVYYYALQDGYQPGGMTITTFVDFMCNTVANDPTFGAQLDASALAQMNQLAQFTDSATIQKQMSSQELAGLLGMDASMIDMLYSLYHGGQSAVGMTMTLPQFTGMLVGLMDDPVIADQFVDATKTQLRGMNVMMQAAVSGQSYSAADMAQLVGLDAALAAQVYTMHYGANDTSWQGNTMTLAEFVGVANALPIDDGLKAALAMLDTSDTSPKNMGEITTAIVALGLPGMDATVAGTLVSQVFLGVASVGHTITLPQFTDFLVNTVMSDPSFAPYFDEATKAQLTQMNQMIAAAATGTPFDAATLAGMVGMDESMIQMLFALSAGSQIPGKTMSPVEFVDYLLGDVAQNPMFADQLGGNLSQFQMMQTIMKSTISGEVYDYSRMACLLDMDAKTMKMLFTLHDSYVDTSSWRLSMHQAVNFIVDNSGEFASMLEDNLSDLETAQKLINGSVAGTRYSSGELAALLGMNASDLNSMFLLYLSEYGDTSSWLLSIQTFVDFINSDVLPNEDFADQFSKDDAESLRTAKTLIDAVVSGKAYTVKELTSLMASLSDELDENTMGLMSLYFNSTRYAAPTRKLSLEQLFDYLSETVMNDPRFSDMLDDEMRADIKDMKVEMDDGLAQMVGAKHSILVLSTTLPAESAQTSAFIEELHKTCDGELTGAYYLIGNSAMNYEMENRFEREMLLITLLTAISIFIVVAIFFKSIAVPAILVLIVQCGVYITVAVSGLLGYSMNYLALLIVQCILMGATIDYGLVFTSYYREKRQTMGIRDALTGAYNGSIHTILTSGLILITVTGIIGFASSDPTIGQICQTIALGATSATLLILFVLPGLLATFDHFVTKKGQRTEDDSEDKPQEQVEQDAYS